MFSLHLGRHGNVAGLVAPTIGRMKDHRVSQYRNTEDAVKRPLSNGPDVTHPSIVRHPNATIPGGRSLGDPVRDRVVPPSVSGTPIPRASGPSAPSKHRLCGLDRSPPCGASRPRSLPRSAPAPPGRSTAQCRCHPFSITSSRADANGGMPTRRAGLNPGTRTGKVGLWQTGDGSAAVR